MKAVLTIPSPKDNQQRRLVNLRSSTVSVARAVKKAHRFTVSAALARADEAGAGSGRTRRGVKVLVTGTTGRDSAGVRRVTKTKTINIRR